MLTEERHQAILRLLDQQSVVKSQELASLLNASESTIRRDLQELEDEKLLERIHGGAKRILNLGFEQDMIEKSSKNTQEKQLIGTLAAQYIQNGDVIYLDAGSTTLEMLPFLVKKDITVVTNSVHHAAKLGDLNIQTIILGGALKLSTKAITGSTGMDQLSHFRFNKVFMGMNGAHLEFGLTTPDPEEAALKRLAIAQAEEAYILVDQTKLNKVTFTKVTDLSDVTLLIDTCSPEIHAESTALGFLGGFTGDFISDWLKKEQIQTNFTPVREDTRINIKLKSETETEINGMGPAIRTKRNLSKISAGDIVILSGSTPATLRAGFYEELTQIIDDKQADFIIDTTGKDLFNALPKKPLLIKPNNHELAELFNVEFQTIEDILPFGKRLLADGAKHVIISMAGDGALLFTSEGIYRSNVLKRPLKNSVGAGDSMIAGFVGNFAKTSDPIEAFKWGVACGSATAFSDDLASAGLIEELIHEVKIEKISS
ncbi:hypothetical protein HW555_014383 [Spodoptera exigua]|uniref:HTH deoR-type domain-containing protein n=1 Tax=Spodoptera exigua TaxID=7107 RepID=A0A835G135_SPOEX|nr:hypothetical protein HW555_014383 [Spodoptera exigua]